MRCALLERTVRRYFEKLLSVNIKDFGKIDPAVAQQLADPDMKRDDLRELMKSVAYPEGWFYVERASVIMFGLSSTLAPKLNGIHVGFPYVTQFIMERNAKRLAEQAARKPVDQSAPPFGGAAARGQAPVVEPASKVTSKATDKPTDPALKATDESEALLN